MIKYEVAFILFTIISAFIINGWFEVTRSGKIFGWWERYWEQYHFPDNDETKAPVYHFPHWVRMPLSQCILCMSSVYGTTIFLIAYFAFHKFSTFTLIQTIFIWAAYLLCLTICNYLVHKKMNGK